MSRGLRIVLVLSLMLMMAGGCASAGKPRHEVLPTPASAKPETAKAMQEGKRLYDAREWTAAQEQYEQAVKLQPTLPEAHYNLGIALYAQRKDVSARKHFVEAANLAPGDKIIWNAPVFQDLGYVEPRSKSDTGTKVMPTIGGTH